MENIRIGIPSFSVYFNIYKIYFEKLGFDVVCTPKKNNNYIECIKESIEYLEDKCEYVVLPNYKLEKIITKNHLNYLIHDIDLNYDKFTCYISNKFYIDENLSKIAYKESIIENLTR